MATIHDAPDVGSPDPEARNSPIFDHDAEELEAAELDHDVGCCYFNGTAYELGQYVCSGSELLQCSERGVWLRRGSCYEQ